MSSPTFATLVDWIEGRLDRDEAAQVSDRVAQGDGRTRSTVRWLRDFLGLARSFPAPEPPPVVRQHLRQHFTRWHRSQAALRAEPIEVTADLLFDSRQDLALAGVRGPDSGEETYHLAFTTAVADLVLDVRRIADGRVRVDGQVLPGEPEAAPVFTAKAAGPGYRVRAVDGDELGRFVLAEVLTGPCRLEVSNGELTVSAEFTLTA